MKQVKFAIVMYSVFLLGGCATYKSQVVNTERIEAYRNAKEVNGIAIAAEPYDTAAKAKGAFYVDVTSKNIKPLQLVIDNKSDDSVMIPRSEMLLIDKTGTEIKPVNSDYVYGRFEKNELAYAFWGFGIFSYMSAEQANEKMKADWYAKELPEERTIISKRKASGFVFFETGEHLSGKTLSVNVLNLKTNQYTKVDVPLN